MDSAYDFGQPANEGSMDKRPPEVSTEKIEAEPLSSPPAARWSPWDRQKDVPAPPPVWTRYIESRLRQFGEGR